HVALRPPGGDEMSANVGGGAAEGLTGLVSAYGRPLLADDVPGVVEKADGLLPSTLVTGDEAQVVEAHGKVQGIGGEPLLDGKGAAVVVACPCQVPLVRRDVPQVAEAARQGQGVGSEPLLDGKGALKIVPCTGDIPLVVGHEPQVGEAGGHNQRVR